MQTNIELSLYIIESISEEKREIMQTAESRIRGKKKHKDIEFGSYFGDVALLRHACMIMRDVYNAQV